MINYLKIAYQINTIWQIMGFVWIILAVVVFLFKKDKITKIIHWISLSFWTIHFLLLGLYTVVVDIIWIIRNFSSIKKKWNNKIII